MDLSKGYCLSSQNIRDLIKRGVLVVPERDLNSEDHGMLASEFSSPFFEPTLESRVQPGSFDCSLGGDAFILDTDAVGLFRPRANQTVYRTLLEVPSRHRRKIQLDEKGAELRSGFTYFIRLNERINFDSTHFEFIKSSPKSSTGRVFPKTRLLVDYNNSFDEFVPLDGKELEMWLLVQPLPFNLIVRPGLTLNQIRFFNGDAKLSASEILEEYSRNPLTFLKGSEIPILVSQISLRDGMQISLDLEAKATFGICGLRARKNPEPIDLSVKLGSPSESYFEPIMAHDGQIMVQRGFHYLFASEEVLRIPSHLSAELRRHSHEGVDGRTHDAGFVDSGFRGDLVFEISPDEETRIHLSHRAPLSRLDLYRMKDVPDKLYGEGSNYQAQQGPKHSKHLTPFDFESGASRHARLNRKVLVQEARLLTNPSLRILSEGFEPINPSQIANLSQAVNRGFFMSRYDCEADELVLQPIPYVLIFGQSENIFSYVRAKNVADYGDKRLFGKHSLGLGGHISPSDSPNFAESCLEREVAEEIIIAGRRSEPILLGTLMAYTKPVDRVHFGLIYSLVVEGEVRVNDVALSSGEMRRINDIFLDPTSPQKHETWSMILLPYLTNLYRTSLDQLKWRT